jgi:hypothetical protein
METNEKIQAITKKYERCFDEMSIGCTRIFSETVLQTMFCEIRDDMDDIYSCHIDTSNDVANTAALVRIYRSVKAIVNQFDDPLQAGLMMKMDVFATLLYSENTSAYKAESSFHVVDLQCRLIDFSGLFFEQALPKGPWKPSADDYPRNGDWIDWYARDQSIGKYSKKRKRR